VAVAWGHANRCDSSPTQQSLAGGTDNRGAVIRSPGSPNGRSVPSRRETAAVWPLAGGRVPWRPRYLPPDPWPKDLDC